MQEEVWKDAKVLKNGELFDFTGLYEASNLGRIRNAKTGRILKPFGNGRGYMRVDLGQKQFDVHRIIATTFLINDNPNEKTDVNHKDENPSNNCVNNLEWCTREYNINYGGHNQRSAETRKGKGYGYKHPNQERKIICVETQQVFNSIREAIDWLGIDYTNNSGNISKCCRGKYKTACGYHWQYVD